jgi:anti-sigma28 factor (negative regulator of flagellin synthesis)
MDMLVDVESFGEAPFLRPFTVDASGLIHGVHPLALFYDRESVKSISDTGNLVQMLEAMPSGLMVWLDDAKAMYDYLDHQFSLQEARSASAEVRRIWFTQPAAPEIVRKLVLADKGHMTRTSRPRTTTVNKRQRDAQGSNSEVQEIANELSKEFRRKHDRWPVKKELVKGIKEKLPARADSEDKTIEREFKTTWKKAT